MAALNPNLRGRTRHPSRRNAPCQTSDECPNHTSPRHETNSHPLMIDLPPQLRHGPHC